MNTITPKIIARATYSIDFILGLSRGFCGCGDLRFARVRAAVFDLAVDFFDCFFAAKAVTPI
jgi:hypothetical protein